MHLEKLEINGFKSFANKTELFFNSPITAVVGPNGSGKSNISDAIRWVLGEQGAKSLRGNKMEDVIFAGTTNRKPLGMAEVSLTLNNSKGILPIEYDEVKITRRMYRSGESEYYLNKSLCRLKDIRELLMDTGIGKEGYSIIGQGKIDEILSTKSEERRQLFEEAVGIVKYKHRKYEAEKKLNDTKDNLLRVKDILYELENQLKPLEKQKDQVIKYNELKKELSKLEINLFIKEIDKIDNELKHIQQQSNMIAESLAIQEKEKEFCNNELKKIQTELELLENNVIEKQKEYYHIQGMMKTVEGEINLIQQNIIYFTESIQRLRNEIDNLNEDNSTSSEEINKKKINLDEINIELEKIESRLKDNVPKYNELNENLILKENHIDKLKSQIIENLNLISNKKAEANSFKTLIETMENQNNQIDRDLQINKDKKKDNDMKLNNFINKFNHIRDVIKDINDKIIQINNEKKQMENEKEILMNDLENKKNELRNNISRYNILKEMDVAGEGYSKSVKNLMKACNKDTILAKGNYGTVADLIKVPKVYEKALEIALGPSIQNIVTETDEDAKRLINYLKKYNLGRATFLPINSIQKKYIRQDELNIINTNKDIKIAMDVIEYDSKFENIFSSLLSRVLIASNIDIAIKMSKALQQKFKIVTIDGDIVNIGGSLTGGSSNFKGNSILSRKRELIELKDNIRELKMVESNLHSKYNSLLNSITELEKKLVNLNENYQENKYMQVKLESDIKQLENENTEIETIINQMKNSNKDLLEAHKSTLDKYINISNEIKDQEILINKMESKINDIQKNLQNEKKDLEILNNSITKDKIKHASLMEQKKSILQGIETLENTIKNNILLIQRKEENIIEFNKKINESKYSKMSKENQLNKMSKDIINLQEEMEVLNKIKEDLLKIEIEKKEVFNQINKIILQLNESNHKLDVKSTKLEIQQQNFYNKLWEDYELTYNKANDMREDIPDNINIIKRIKELKDEIKSLGHLNLQAIEEYEDLKERYVFLSKQNEDLKEAQKSLVKIIKDIESKMEKQFMEEFTKIQKNFNNVFVKLFNGGKAELILEDENDVLNSGIEIIAQPPGKKLQSLSLLSGGEKALTAISLLFGILLVKPSPFCVLDEIEAALDDANVDRFAKFLCEISSETQFIIITHRKGTMEIADTLYGTTMAEEGVTKILSISIKDKNNKEIAS